jgi:hypothetical protein
MKGFTELETAVLEWMATHLAVPHLSEQIHAASVTARDYTKVGFFTSLSVSHDLPAIEAKSPINGPVIESPGIEHDGGAIVFLDNNGHIQTLEMYANGNRFDETITEFRLKSWEESNRLPVTD